MISYAENPEEFQAHIREVKANIEEAQYYKNKDGKLVKRRTPTNLGKVHQINSSQNGRRYYD